jgi:pimeloyl-ACP methyl ester carboxylesterase
MSESVLSPAAVDAAVALANTDAEFRYEAGGLQATVTLRLDEVTYRLVIDGGTVAVAADGSPAVGTEYVFSGPDEMWAKLLAPVPPSGFVDFVGAGYAGFSVTPAPDRAETHLALRRLVRLLGHARNGTDPSPKVIPAAPAHGTHDAAVGRYIHLDLGGTSYRVYYEEAGSGIPLLCQHTAGSDGRQWRHLLEDERITSRFRVIAYDLPFHGKSVPPSGVAWWAQEYKLTREFLMSVPVTLASALGLDRPAFIGASVGGMLALDLARFHPDVFRGVISCEGALYLGAGAADDDESAVRDFGHDPALHAATMMSSMSATAPEAYQHETRFHYSQGAPGIYPGDIYYFSVDHDLRGQAELLNTPECPVYMLTGEYDFATVPVSQQAAAEIPGVHLEIMAGLGHFPMSEDPVRFAEYVVPLLDRIAAATPAATQA